MVLHEINLDLNKVKKHDDKTINALAIVFLTSNPYRLRHTPTSWATFELTYNQAK
jgi:hypothetical protein